jgi:prepilin-type N-terminal cleavage/methylation domain-containing protein
MKSALSLIKNSRKNSRGFTLIEILVVIGILAVLLAITLIAITPAKQFSPANNTQRRSDVNAILNAVNQYAADNKGNISALNIPQTPSAAIVIGNGQGQLDICSVLVPKYIAALPVDPLTNNGTPVDVCTASYDANYTIVQSANDQRITVSAPAAELQETITVTR